LTGSTSSAAKDLLGYRFAGRAFEDAENDSALHSAVLMQNVGEVEGCDLVLAKRCSQGQCDEISRQTTMTRRDLRFETLREVAANQRVVAAMESFVGEALDAVLCRVNVLDVAKSRSLREDDVIDAFLHAAKLGLFEMTWSLCCPGCGGVLDAGTTPKAFRKEHYPCVMCAASHEAPIARASKSASVE
jgi:hypothetical protein